mmetsp:Transcript_46216/g.105422  ORF Transcript_46216/g.105422 Transcript_46216/m.105422 type:complete len:326 (+) Transcript_46216:71-1048(+)
MGDEEEIAEYKQLALQLIPDLTELTFHAVLQNNVSERIARDIDEEEVFGKVMALETVHLEWLYLARLHPPPVVTSLRNCRVLFLQHNRLRKVEGIAGFQSLEFLALQSNFLTDFSGIERLPSLVFLDLRDNFIESEDPSKLPSESLQILKLKGNPIANDEGFVKQLWKVLPVLSELDREEDPREMSRPSSSYLGRSMTLSSMRELEEDDQEEDGAALRHKRWDAQKSALDSTQSEVKDALEDYVMESQMDGEEMGMRVADMQRRSLQRRREAQEIANQGEQRMRSSMSLEDHVKASRASMESLRQSAADVEAQLRRSRPGSRGGG